MSEAPGSADHHRQRLLVYIDRSARTRRRAARAALGLGTAGLVGTFVHPLSRAVVLTALFIGGVSAYITTMHIAEWKQKLHDLG